MLVSIYMAAQGACKYFSWGLTFSS